MIRLSGVDHSLAGLGATLQQRARLRERDSHAKVLANMLPTDPAPEATAHATRPPTRA